MLKGIYKREYKGELVLPVSLDLHVLFGSLHSSTTVTHPCTSMLGFLKVRLFQNGLLFLEVKLAKRLRAGAATLFDVLSYLACLTDQRLWIVKILFLTGLP